MNRFPTRELSLIRRSEPARLVAIVLVAALFSWLTIPAPKRALADQVQPSKETKKLPAAAQVFMARVPLPLTGDSDERFMATIDKLLDSIQNDTTRPILVL